MTMRRIRSLGPLLLLAIVVAVTAGFFWWVLHSPDQVRVFLVQLVLISLLIFLGILLIRFFTLLWFGFLQHAERDVTETREDAELPPVSVIVPAYNEGPVLERAVRSLLRLDYPAYEILVIDDGSQDDTFATALAWEGVHDGVPVRVFSKPNGGKATALNLGIEQAVYPFVLCMDADSSVEPQLLRRAIPHFEDASVGAVAGNVKVENRRKLITRLQALEYIEGLNMPRRAQGFIAAVNIVPGPVGVFRREALQDVDGYDTDTFAEDADLTLKMISAGWKIVYEDQAVAWTQAPERWLDLIQQRYRWTRGILQSIRKRKGLLLKPVPDFPLWLSVLEMGFEAVVWPIMNVYAHLFFAVVALLFGMGELLLYWWILLTLLDMVAALVTVSMEEEELSLVPLAVVYRVFFILFLDVTKAFAAIEELFRFRMDWDQVRRLPVPDAGEVVS
ncbi:MAG: glycosyltransferase family 2 protein [Gemmatimonadota bacterium]|nr:glycosyltransferase family 2 protein [Gemmatimonadota bacterium]